ncbi:MULTISPECIES: type II toxin-antitoxin system RelE/ParE family toxin [Hansschlegelia]|uniref:Type II toxin-antitoxin system RelE/ParE family toxin n=1 Tax=Hansschlegelia zhihuaiae TaxID=405005 RepID=A0A4Q0MDL5_9HYPH|nr:type II toxin-antitoxin system RelE/ParE family toxin [Hansschlegelia zhihuaiae]RXF71491.1 hypothetical protein EK403_15600 [Hansschlegelia zhihuaiae]
MKVRISEMARTYLRKEAAYLKKNSSQAAAEFQERMNAARRNLAQFPNIGHEDTRCRRRALNASSLAII